MSGAPPLYGGFWRRAGGAAIDALVFMVPETLLAQLGVAVADPWIDFAVWALAGWIYYAACHSSRFQATLGQRAFGMWITDLRGDRIGFARASGRFAASWISAILLLMGYLMAAWNPRRQTLHDRIAGTVVVRAGAAGSEVAGGGGIMPTPLRTRVAVGASLAAALAFCLGSVWLAEDPPSDRGAVPAASAFPAKEESLSYAIYTLPFLEGDPQLSSEGTRRYRHSDVRVLGDGDSSERVTFKTIDVAEGYSIQASIFPEERLEGFGLSLQRRGNGFSWEWFDRESGDVFRKRQGSGRVQVRFVAVAGREEPAEVLFLDDVTMRLNRYWFVPFRHRDSDHLVVKRGSVLWLAD